MIKLGGVLKKRRLDKDMTLEDVAALCGYSKALISRIENNSVFPSLDSLTKIAAALELPLYEVFASAPPEEPTILRKEDRQRFIAENGEFEMAFLVANPSDVAMLPVFYSGDPGAHSTHRMGMHVGQEWTIIMQGKVEVTVSEKKYVLREGDSIYFNSNLPHRYKNIGKGHAEGVSICIPPFY